MNIETMKESGVTRLKLSGRFDASWCDHVDGVFAETIRQGEHHLRVDMAEVHYLSSAGIRLLLKTFKELKAIGGSFQIVHPSANAKNVLELAGLQPLMAETTETKQAKESAPKVETRESASATFEVHATGAIPSMKVRTLGNEKALSANSGQLHDFESPAVLIGVGAIGRDAQDNQQRMGELIAVAGNVAYQPTDGAKQPDYMTTHGQLKADGQAVTAILADALPTGLIRFEAKDAGGVIGMAELAEEILCIAKSDAAVMVALAETAGLIGTALRQSPALAGEAGRFDFPGVRDWLSFSHERIHRDTTCLIAGVVARPGTPIDHALRPLDAKGQLLGHLHAAVFPYHPLRKGEIDLTATVNEAFSDRNLQAVLHLLADMRELIGAGESQCYRGACWYAPAQF